MSAVVIQELTAGARDNSRLQELDAVRRRYEKEGRLLVPTGEDWWLAGKVLNSLARVLKSGKKTKEANISKAEQQRILRDVLIARTAHREGVIVVTSTPSTSRKFSHIAKCELCIRKTFSFDNSQKTRLRFNGFGSNQKENPGQNHRNRRNQQRN